MHPDNFMEGDNWFRFNLNDHAFQGGEKNGQLYLNIALDEIDHEQDFNVVFEAMKAANRAVKSSAKLEEADNFFLVVLKLPASLVNIDTLPKWLDEMARVASHPEIGAVSAEYRQW